MSWPTTINSLVSPTLEQKHAFKTVKEEVESSAMISNLIPGTRGGKSTKIFYSSKSTITLLKFYLSTSKSSSLKIYSSKSKK